MPTFCPSHRTSKIYTALNVAADPGATAAVEAASGALSRAFATAEVMPDQARSRGVTTEVLAQIGRDLIRAGQSVHVIEVSESTPSGERSGRSRCWERSGGRRAAAGASIRAIARELDLDRKTVPAAEVGHSARVLFQELRRRLRNGEAVCASVARDAVAGGGDADPVRDAVRPAPESGLHCVLGQFGQNG